MARLPLKNEQTAPELTPLLQSIREQRNGKLLVLYQVLLNSPPVAEGWLTLLTAIRQQTHLEPRLRELIILRVAMLNGARYEFDVHAPIARDGGLPQEAIDGLAHGEVSGLLTETERDVVGFTDALTRDCQVPDDLYSRVARSFDERQMLEITATVASYNMVSRLLNALRIDQEPG